jgi:hypothetical protein
MLKQAPGQPVDVLWLTIRQANQAASDGIDGDLRQFSLQPVNQDRVAQPSGSLASSSTGFGQFAAGEA